MSKELLKEYIKKAVRQKLKEEEIIEANREKSVYLIYKFPGLKQVFLDLMSPAFARFITSVKIVAPKPTTFEIKLLNGLNFYVYYANKGKFISKISGKRYFMNKLQDIERASQAITDLLELNYNEEEFSKEKADDKRKTDDLKAAIGGGGGSSPSGPIGPGIDPDAPPDAQIPGTEPTPLPGEEPAPGTEPEEEPEENPEKGRA